MSNPVFDTTQSIGNQRAPNEITDFLNEESDFRACMFQEGDVSVNTIVEFFGRFALLCSVLYPDSVNKLTIDAVHPNITIDCEELRQALEENPGKELPTPVNIGIFTQVFSTLSAVDLVIKPAQYIPTMPTTFAKVSWERTAPSLIDFYAQGGRSPDGRDFVQELYARMFNVAESAPRTGIDVALGIFATVEMRRYGVGVEQYNREQRENFDNISSALLLPDSRHYLDPRSTAMRPRSRTGALSAFVKRFFRKA